MQRGWELAESPDDPVRKPKSKARRWIGGFCALVLAVGNPMERAQASELDDLMGSETAAHTVSNAELAEQRGGWSTNGVLVNFGLDISTRVNGIVERTTKIVIESVERANATVKEKTSSINVPTNALTSNSTSNPSSSKTSSLVQPSTPETSGITDIASVPMSQITLGVTKDGKLVVKDVTEQLPQTTGNTQTSSGLVTDPAPSGDGLKLKPEVPSVGVSNGFANLKPGQVLDAAALTGLLSQSTPVVNDHNNVTIETMRSLTVDIINFSDIRADAMRAMVGASLSSFVNNQALFALPR